MCERLGQGKRYKICTGEIDHPRRTDYLLSWYASGLVDSRDLIAAGVEVPEWQPDQPSRGLGDTIAKWTHATGIDRVTQAVSRVTGKPCGCKGRQAALNEWLPFNKKSPD